MFQSLRVDRWREGTHSREYFYAYTRIHEEEFRLSLSYTSDIKAVR